ncbi:MAG: hypothetical protein H0W42_05975 [Gemmatimonadaceae bacterium]|nr:hypothetical protein [Gemmatimonadaceae bacterium]
MKHTVGIVLALVFAASAAPAVVAQSAPDAVAVDPTHNVVLENDHVRVYQALAAPGARSPMHSHRPFVFVGLGRARLRMGLSDGSSAIMDIHPGQVMWLENAQHSWELLAGNAHVIGVEVKGAARGAAPGPVARPATDAVTVDPAHHHVVIENDHVRVYDVLASAGDRSPMHSHPPLAIVSHETARVRLTMPDGSKAMLDLHPGQVLWLENPAHSWELLSGQLRLTVVEPKAAAAK